jgi:hypothetical protein
MSPRSIGDGDAGIRRRHEKTKESPRGKCHSALRKVVPVDRQTPDHRQGLVPPPLPVLRFEHRLHDDQVLRCSHARVPRSPTLSSASGCSDIETNVSVFRISMGFMAALLLGLTIWAVLLVFSSRAEER